MPGETDKTIRETIDFVVKLMPYYPDSLRKVIDNKIVKSIFLIIFKFFHFVQRF